MNKILNLSATSFENNLPDWAAPTTQILPMGGILVPSFSDMSTDSVSNYASTTAANLLSGSSGSISFFRNSLPYNDIAAWTHSLSKTPTDKWMDVVDGAVRGPNHRWLHHNPIDFAKAWWEQGANNGLQWNDYLRHSFLDSITIKGIPLLPEAIHAKLVALGIPPSALFAWTHLNLFDLTVGSLSVIGSGTHMFLAITGCLPWNGTETFLLTFGMGVLQIGGGLAFNNPLLVTGGALDCMAGATSYWNHIHIPKLSLIETIVPGLLGGLIAGSAITATRMLLCWNSTTPKERVLLGTESMGLSILMGTLATVSPWLSLPIAVAYTAGKFAFKLAQNSDIDYPLSSSLTAELCRDKLFRVGGQEAVESFEAYLRKETKLVPTEISKHLAPIPDWGTAPKGTEHVFGKRISINW